jgi:hypothetical protein
MRLHMKDENVGRERKRWHVVRTYRNAERITSLLKLFAVQIKFNGSCSAVTRLATEELLALQSHSCCNGRTHRPKYPARISRLALLVIFAICVSRVGLSWLDEFTGVLAWYTSDIKYMFGIAPLDDEQPTSMRAAILN